MRDKHLLTCPLAYYFLVLATPTSPSTVTEIPDDAPSRPLYYEGAAPRPPPKNRRLNRKLPEEKPTPRPRVDRGEQCEQQPEL